METLNFSNYKFRCHALGKLLTESKSKDEILSKTAMTYLNEIFIEAKYGKKKDITSKYMEKGLLCEEDALQLLSDIEGVFLIKNKQRFENDFITGEPDNIHGGVVRDTKASWDIFTFHKSGLTKAYEAQIRGYLWLTGVEVGLLAYCLVDTPAHLIYSECKKLAYHKGVIDWENDEEFQKEMEEIEQSMTFSEIPVRERVKTFNIIRDADFEKRCEEKIWECRSYLNTLAKGKEWVNKRRKK